MNQGNPRFGRVPALTTEDELEQPERCCSCRPHSSSDKHATVETQQKPQDIQHAAEKNDWQQRILELTEQVNALKLRQHSREDRSQQSQNHMERELPEQNRQQPSEQRRSGLVCWNCDEEGHRCTNCPKPQAGMFCYRCGHRGYSVRNCPTCRTGLGNGSAGNH